MSNWSIKCRLIAFRGLAGTDKVFYELLFHCQNSSATRELLFDCFAFDPQKWATVLVTDIDIGTVMGWEGVLNEYTFMVELKIWFQAQVRFPNLYIVYY